MSDLSHSRRHPVKRTVVVAGDCDGYVGRLRWGQNAGEPNPLPYWIDFEIVQLVGGDNDGVQLYSGEMHPVENIDEAEVHVRGFIKWDGCMQWNADAHTDDPEDLELLFDCIRQTRLAAIEAMGERWYMHEATR